MSTFSIQVNAWQREASVSFNGTGISESIILRPSSGFGDPAAYADAMHAAAIENNQGNTIRHKRSRRKA